MTPERFRVIGSIALFSGYVLLVNDFDWPGLQLRLAGNLAMIPFAVKYKAIDLVLLQSAFALVTFAALLHG